MSESAIVRLQRWYRAQCDGDWEHSYGIKIETLDNPGWEINVDLRDTRWEDFRRPLEIVERSEGDWIHTKWTDACFNGAGGAGNFEELIERFLQIVETQAS